MGWRTTTHLEHCQWKMGCFRVFSCPFLGCEGVPHRLRWVVMVVLGTEEGCWHHRGIRTRFYYGRERYYPLEDQLRKTRCQFWLAMIQNSYWNWKIEHLEVSKFILQHFHKGRDVDVIWCITKPNNTIQDFEHMIQYILCLSMPKTNTMSTILTNNSKQYSWENCELCQIQFFKPNLHKIRWR